MTKQKLFRPAAKPRKRQPAPVTIRPREHRTARLKSTADTIPPFFPSLDLPAETLIEPAPVILVCEGQRIEVPAILLEAEHPQAPASAGDGQLHVTARDPHWLYVHWDLTRDQQTKLNSESNHGHLVMRAYVNSLNSEPSTENHVHPQSRHWFVHVQMPGATYYVELGLYAGKEWRRVAVAGPITTPARRFAFDTSATWLTIRQDLPLAEQLEARRAAGESTATKAPAAGAFDSGEHPSDWSPEQQDAVLRALGVIRVAESLSSHSGTDEFAEDESVSSADGGFGEAIDVADLGGSSSVSSPVPPNSLLESPVSSS